VITVPQSFYAQPRWWTDGTGWLDSLPARFERLSRVWGLEPAGRPMHGSNALVVPVVRGTQRLALRLSPPDDRTATEIAALAFWAGRGTVLQLDSDPEQGASLLEWLDAERSLRELSLDQAAPVLGRLMRRLAVPLDPSTAAPATADLIGERIGQLAADWEQLGRPFPAAVWQAAVAAGRELTKITDQVAVNGDLHHDQVLAGSREQWLVVDPVLLRGDICYDLARCLWWRLDEMADDAMINRQLMIIADAAEVDRDHARTSVIFRTVDYWLWGLRNGLTEDPVRCARLYAAVTT
jgi:streptomycin 6-kinase